METSTSGQDPPTVQACSRGGTQLRRGHVLLVFLWSLEVRLMYAMFFLYPPVLFWTVSLGKALAGALVDAAAHVRGCSTRWRR